MMSPGIGMLMPMPTSAPEAESTTVEGCSSVKGPALPFYLPRNVGVIVRGNGDAALPIDCRLDVTSRGQNSTFVSRVAVAKYGRVTLAEPGLVALVGMICNVICR
jgi:hypothetical protein